MTGCIDNGVVSMGPQLVRILRHLTGIALP